MKKTLLITGGTGYIGSHAVVAFEQAGYKTVIIDNLINSSKETLKNIEKILGYIPEFFECDLNNKDKLQEIFSKYNFDGVIHFAGLKSPLESQKQTIKYFLNNIGGSLTLFDVMVEKGVTNLVFSSSANTYSPNNVPPILEEDFQETTNPYGTSKLLIEKILSDLSNFSKFNCIILRYFNPIGAHESGFLGESPIGVPNNLFPYIFKVLFGKIEELKIFGGNYNTVDGTGVRDYIDVNDLVDAHVLSYNYLKNKGLGGFYDVFNVGTGIGISVLEAVHTVEKISGKKINYSIIDRREGDIPISYCSNNKIKDSLGFKPKIGLQKSIINMLNYYQKNNEN